ncbi:MAG: hypothetical protein WC596_04445 [Candidatus Shapirobacteria bacterium]
MIHIFHGDNVVDSRAAFNSFLDQNQKTDILRLDPKVIDLDQINNFLNGPTLFSDKKTLAISNLFSVAKSTLDKLNKLLATSDSDVAIWQDKALTTVQLKIFPKAQIKIFRLPNQLFTCLNSVRPHNLKNTILLYHQVLKLGLFDLFLYLLKNSLRKQLTSYSPFSKDTLKNTYLQLIELDFQNKSGELPLPKEIALERILINLTA